MTPYLALEASAGSGKTFALSVRYIALVLQGNDISKILALTFTKKAANEMKQRITSAFCDLHLKEDGRPKGELEELCTMLGLSEDEVLALRDKYMDSFLRAELKISTFDSFFTMVLRQFSLNLGFMPDFSVGQDESDLVRADFIKALYENGLLSSFAHYIQSVEGGKNGVLESIEKLYMKLDEIDLDVNNPFPDPKNVLSKFDELGRYSQLNYTNSYLLGNFNAKSISEIVKKPIIDKFEGTGYFRKTDDDDKFLSLREELLELLRDYYKSYEKFRINELLKFIGTYKQVRTNVLKTKNSLEFGDVTKLVYNLLSKDLDKEMLYFRIDGRIKHILIDEFQDTNVLQYEILFPLIEEALSGDSINGVGSLFYVGDTKQSIYRFRGAKKELFYKLADKFKQIKIEHLEHNYRSAKHIVNFVNQTFKDKISGFIAQIPKSNENGYVGISQFDKDDFFEALRKKIEFLTSKNVSYNDIAVLCWKNNDITKIKEYLEDHSIPVVSSSTNLLIDTLSVRLVLEFIKYCLFKDEIYAQTLNEFLGYKPNILNLKIENSLCSTLKFVAKYLKLSCFDKNLLKLYEISSDYKDIFDLIFNIAKRGEQSADTSHQGISLMSVHKSKGLEFDTVIVVDFLGNKDSRKETFLSEYDDKNKKWNIKLNDKALGSIGDKEYINLKQTGDLLDRQEDLNKLYVALTRAKSNLLIMAKSDPDGKNISYFKPYGKNTQNEYLHLNSMEIGEVVSKKDEKKSLEQIHLKPFEKVKKQDIKTVKDRSLSELSSIYFGKALHYALEMMDGFSESSLQNAQIALLNEFGSLLETSVLDEIYERILNLIKCDEFLNLLNAKIILKEQDIAFEGEIKRLDMLCVGENEMIVFDYKSSKNYIDSNLDQVKEYVEILSQIYPQYRVYGKIVYILKDKIELLDVQI